MAPLPEKDISTMILDLKAEDLKKDMLSKYPTKVARKRAKQIVVNKVDPDGCVPEIAANVRTIPGIITQRGCTYAGCKGVVLGPTRDIVNITHGPIGCGFYTWLTRRNQTRPPTGQTINFMTYCFSTDMQEEEIVFGGEKKLQAGHPGGLRPLPAQGHRHLLHLPRGPHRRRRPRGGPGDEGKAGDQHLRLQLRGLQGRQPVGRPPHRQQRASSSTWWALDDTVKEGKFKINLLGEYNIGGDAFEIERLFEALRHHAGLHLQRQLELRLVCQLPTRPTSTSSCATAPSTTWPT